MIKKIMTVLRKTLPVSHSKDQPAPSWEEIRKVLNQTAEIQARAAKQQATWETKREQERKHAHETEQRRIAEADARWEAQREQEREERAQERAQERKERAQERKQAHEAEQRRIAEADARWEAQREQERKERAQEREEREQERKQMDIREERRMIEREVKMDALLKGMGVRLGGLTNNVGKIAEEYFFNALKNEKTITINGAHFNNNVLADKRFKRHKKAMQCDLVLINAQYLAIVEVKFYLHPKDVEQFDNKLRQVLPHVLPAEYQHLQLMPVIACLGISFEAQEEAQARGFVLMRQDGETARFESEHLRPRPLSITKRD